jgi:Insertion element 4 transposase N-terminal
VWSVPASGGITQARQRLGYEPFARLFGRSNSRWRASWSGGVPGAAAADEY